MENRGSGHPANTDELKHLCELRGQNHARADEAMRQWLSSVCRLDESASEVALFVDRLLCVRQQLPSILHSDGRKDDIDYGDILPPQLKRDLLVLWHASVSMARSWEKSMAAWHDQNRIHIVTLLVSVGRDM